MDIKDLVYVPKNMKYQILYMETLYGDGQKNTTIEMDMIGLKTKNQYIGCLKKFLINKIYFIIIKYILLVILYYEFR